MSKAIYVCVDVLHCLIDEAKQSLNKSLDGLVQRKIASVNARFSKRECPHCHNSL